MSSDNPSSLFGGTWKQIAGGRVLVGEGGSYDAGDTGGEETHKMTINEMPRHQHSANLLHSSSNSGDVGSVSAGNKTGSTQILNTDWQGGGAAFNIMQPYLVCYMWQRTA